eukprot:SM000054S18138  [mRNA]  locus=s54:613990:616111:+ [translate_table: standard]
MLSLAQMTEMCADLILASKHAAGCGGQFQGSSDAAMLSRIAPDVTCQVDALLQGVAYEGLQPAQQRTPPPRGSAGDLHYPTGAGRSSDASGAEAKPPLPRLCSVPTDLSRLGLAGDSTFAPLAGGGAKRLSALSGSLKALPTLDINDCQSMSDAELWELFSQGLLASPFRPMGANPPSPTQPRLGSDYVSEASLAAARPPLTTQVVERQERPSSCSPPAANLDLYEGFMASISRPPASVAAHGHDHAYRVKQRDCTSDFPRSTISSFHDALNITRGQRGELAGRAPELGTSTGLLCHTLDGFPHNAINSGANTRSQLREETGRPASADADPMAAALHGVQVSMSGLPSNSNSNSSDGDRSHNSEVKRQRDFGVGGQGGEDAIQSKRASVWPGDKGASFPWEVLASASLPDDLLMLESTGGKSKAAKERGQTRMARRTLMEKRRRERISDGLRMLEKVTPKPKDLKLDTASMLERTLAYVKFLEQQVQVLSKKGKATYSMGSPSKGQHCLAS